MVKRLKQRVINEKQHGRDRLRENQIERQRIRQIGGIGKDRKMTAILFSDGQNEHSNTTRQIGSMESRINYVPEILNANKADGAITWYQEGGVSTRLRNG